jgi:hypothetical protein
MLGNQLSDAIKNPGARQDAQNGDQLPEVTGLAYALQPVCGKPTDGD